MKSLFVVLFFCLCSYAFASKCNTPEETDYALNFVDNMCPKLKQNPNIDMCYENNGIMVKNYAKDCGNTCDGNDKATSIESECCFIRAMVDSGRSIARKKAVDATCCN